MPITPTIIAEIDKYVNEKRDFVLALLQGGTHSLLVANTGSGKTTFCLETAKQSNYTILLSPTRVIVDQMMAEAKKTNLTILRHDQLGDWAFGELQLNTNSKIWIGTFAALKKAQPDWSICDYVFIDEVHFLLDLSLFGKETALDVWELTQTIEKYPNTKLVSLTASDELVLPLKQFFKFDKIFLVKSEKWRLKPNKIYIYPTIQGMNNIQYILHYAKNHVKEGEKVLCVVKSYRELRQLRDVVDFLPADVEIANAQDKKDSETYWEICFNSQYPKRIRVFITTTWISLGASILDPDVKHVICTFPNYSIVHQSLSRIRAGEVNVAVMQLASPMEEGEQLKDISFETIANQIATYAKDRNTYIDYFALHKGKWMFFPLPQISEIYQKQQEALFSDLPLLKKTLEKNLDCEVGVVWDELLPFRRKVISSQEYSRLKQYALALRFPVTADQAFKNAMQLTVK